MDGSTKWRIFVTAIELFSDNGYNKVSMRDIADAVGIKPGSIYSHFESKDDILVNIYEFYEYHATIILPDINSLLLDAETMDVRQLLKKTDIHFLPEAQHLMDRIMIILAMERRGDPRSEELIMKCQYDHIEKTFRPLLNKLMELKRIEKIDVDAFIDLYFNFSHGAALRGYSRQPVSSKEWLSCLSMVYSLVKQID